MSESYKGLSSYIQNFHTPGERDEDKFVPEDDDETNYIEWAMEDAGIDPKLAPKIGTVAYDKVKNAAEKYINYILTKKYFDADGKTDLRRVEHNKLCILIYGRDYEELNKQNRDRLDQLSNFAAYFTKHEELLNTW